MKIVALFCVLAQACSMAAAEHWSLRPLANVPIPRVKSDWVQTPVDAFIWETLERKGMHPSAPAEKSILLRRVFFDLIGLPPTPTELNAFLSDQSPEAFSKVVDGLLERPQYGERWARRWLDLVHYAESHGHDQDRMRTNAWPYRDYVIASFNGDKPYAVFVQEQIAGDVMFPSDPSATVAMGFLATGPWDESSLRDIREDSIDRQIARYVDRDDIVTTVMNTFASTTVQCARCHDHKFDPIPQKEYYSLQAVFAGTEKGERYYDRDPKLHETRQALLRRKRALSQTPAGANGSAGETNQELSEIGKQLSALPKPLLVYAGAYDFVPDAGHKPVDKPRPVHVLKRGDIHKPGDEASPGALSLLPHCPGDFHLGTDAPEAERRKQLALWLSNSKNGLVWRSIVNRVWQHHFGRGIVSTPNDFGKMGDEPSHPELLEWLAAWFLDQGGRVKALHRLILLSAAYQQSSRDNPEFSERDRDNVFLWRMNRSRLDAECARDAILMVNGKLLFRMGGPSDQQFSVSPGIHVTPNVDYSAFDLECARAQRRGIYRFIFRTLPDPLMDALDCPDPSQLTPARNNSITVAQALALWNDRFTLRSSEQYAERLRAACDTPEEQARLACLQLFSREPCVAEIERYASFIRQNGLAPFCRVMFNSNEFMFVN